MKKKLSKPENWQDFESLCKKLWGEIWECSEIKKNGRSGQKQYGVDIYGIPKGEIEYFGIQCKGKDDYINANLSKEEIITEIDKVKLFKPKLKKFYLATTANKDTYIEEFIRVKDIENRKNGLFEIHLFCWEDIVDLIEENKRTFDWYVKNINYKTSFSVLVSFQDESKKLVFKPKLRKNHITYKLKKFENFSFGLHTYSPEENRANRIKIATEPQPIRYYLNGTFYNESSSVFSIRLCNTGNTSIINYKFFLKFIGKGIVVDTVDKKENFVDLYQYEYNICFQEGRCDAIFKPKEKILVPKDIIQTDKICIRPTIEESQEIEVKWQIISEDFDDNGSLFIEIIPEIFEEHSIVEYEYAIEDEIILENITKY